MTIRNLDEANRVLFDYVPLVAQVTGTDMTLARIRPLMQLLGDPQERLRVVHIAGTSGKTSTAYYMAELLKAAGKKVGLTVSPHIDTIRERVQIDGVPLREEEFCKLLGEFLEIIKAAVEKPTYFELLYAFAIWVFEGQHVDYAVVETGMGGLHDATNVITKAAKVCAITDIGLDHTHILGESLGEITAQKVGIVQPGNHLFMYEQDAEVMKVIAENLKSKQATLHLVKTATLANHMPAFQQRNWILAHSVYEYLAKRDALPHLTRQALGKTMTLHIPGRMEIRQLHGKTLIMDGAHNAQKMSSFLDSFRQLYPNDRPVILVGLKDGKEYAEVVSALTAVANRVIATAFHTTQDLPVRSMSPEELAQAFSFAGIKASAISEQHEAYRALLNGDEKVCIITGSFYLLSQIRNNEDLL